MSEVQKSTSVVVEGGKLIASGEIEFKEFASLEARLKLDPIGAVKYITEVTKTTKDNAVLAMMEPWLRQALSNIEGKKLAANGSPETGTLA